MTANYQQTALAGTQWKRSKRVQIENPYGGEPTVVFTEEIAITLADGTVVTIPAGTLEVTFDASTVIPLINPWTGEPLTNVDNVPQFATHLEAYILLHSLYLQNATIRDTPVPNVDPGPSEPPPPPPE
jgi:hypothetical protein